MEIARSPGFGYVYSYGLDCSMHLSFMTSLYLAQLLVTSVLLGLIWVIQLVHYPSFAYVDQDRFQEFHHLHTSRMTWIVAPLMPLELGLAVCLLGLDIELLTVLNLLSVLLLFFWTFFISVPIHNRLEHGYSKEYIQKLVFTNWPRTLLWTLRIVIVISMLYQH
jgi:hypothetical protein